MTNYCNMCICCQLLDSDLLHHQSRPRVILLQETVFHCRAEVAVAVVVVVKVSVAAVAAAVAVTAVAVAVTVVVAVAVAVRAAVVYRWHLGSLDLSHPASGIMDPCVFWI